ncbi:MAG: ExbD/TolR family protein [Bacteroidia bacterium]
MKITRNNRFTAHVEASSMNDIMFFLLLFFLIVSTLVNPSVVKLTLPSSKKAMEMNRQQITIDVTKDMKYYLNGSATPTSAEQLEDQLRVKIAGLTDPTAVLRLDKSLTVQDLVDVLQIGSDLKMKMILATQPAKK